MAISSPLQSKVPVGSSKTIRKLQTILLNRTKSKREIFQRQTILQNRRIENETRKQREDELEAPNLVTKPRGAAGLIAGSAKGFFERLVGFLSYLTAGWIVNNLPTWIAMGKEFIARTQQMGKILGGFITNSTNIFKNFTKLLGAGLTNLMKFDFLDTSGRVSTAFDELNLSVENWGAGFEDVIKLITTPLTEGIASGEDARPLGTENTNEGAYERTAPYSGTSSTGDQVGGNAIFGATGNVSNAPGFVHGHFQTNSGTENDVVNDTAPIVRGLLDSGITPELSRGQKFSKNMSMEEIKKLIRLGLSQHGHSGDGRSVDIFVPKGTKVPFPLSDVRDTGGRGGVTGVLLGSGKTWVGHLDPKSKSGGGVPRSNPSPSLSASGQPQQNLMGTPSSSGGGDVGPWRPLLNLIASKESAGGGYEALNPGTTFPGATKMTISEVAREAERRRGRGTGAVGKYQQLPWFLVGRAKKAGLNPDKDLFSPANQDLIAAKVNIGMERSGNSWLAGKMKTEDFMQGLSQEFAPVPNAYGKFHYRGQSSDMTPQQVKAALEQVKKGGGSQISSPARRQSPTPAPATPQSPTPSPAQISSTRTPQNPQISQSLAPERTGPTVIVSQNPSSPAQQMMSSGGGGSSGGGSSQISDFALLNNFIKNKLLLDLAYL